MSSVQPHLLASAVVLDAGGTRTLLARTGEFRRWDLLGGHVEGGEPLAEAARRAVRDLGGVGRFRVISPHLAVQQDIVDCGRGEARHVDHIFAVVAEPDEPAGDFDLDAPEQDLGWFAVTDLPQPLAPGVSMHLRSARREVFG
jgi:ADP-ribose pyrophosphatase YjhB (NUDIX family)